MKRLNGTPHAAAGTGKTSRSPAYRAPSRRRTQKVPERNVQAACLEWLNTLPYIVAWRQNTGGMKGKHNDKSWYVRFGQVGQSDITGMFHGLRLEIECKATGKRVDEGSDQAEWISMIRKHGGVAFWCDSIERCVFEMRSAFQERGLNWRQDWEI